MTYLDAGFPSGDWDKNLKYKVEINYPDRVEYHRHYEWISNLGALCSLTNISTKDVKAPTKEEIYICTYCNKVLPGNVSCNCYK